jgi:serine/threonine protein kinase
MLTNRTTGTLRWQAPELLFGMDTDSHTTFATDVYAFAMVCYEVNRFTFLLKDTLTLF